MIGASHYRYASQIIDSPYHRMTLESNVSPAQANTPLSRAL